MKKHLAVYLAVGFLMCILLSQPAYVQEQDKKEGQLTIPWEEFKNLLNLDADDIVLPLEVFQKLLAQTGVTIKPVYTVKQGNVVLHRSEFKKLVDQMKPPAGPDVKPPFDYLITRAVYSGKMGQQTTVFEGTFTVHVLKPDAYLKIPFLPQNIALEDINIDGEPALVVSENGYHHVVLSRSGEYRATAKFSMKSQLDKGPHKLDLYIQQTPITLFQLEMPLKDITVEVPQAQQLMTEVKNSKTYLSAVIAPGRAISVQWRKKIAVSEKIPPKLYSEVYHLISIDDDALRVNSEVNYNILHSEVDAVQIGIPENMNVLTVTGAGVGEWQELNQQERRVILVPFTYGKKGSVKLYLTSEVPLSESGLSSIFRGFRTLETVRENGFIGVELNTSAEVTIPESEGVEKVPPQKLPDLLTRKSVKPLIMGFKYLKHPFQLVMDVTKHEKIAVPVATINSANIVTLFTEDGKIVHRLIYQVRNSAKQFLEIQLPSDADVWSVFVDHKPVESSMRKAEQPQGERKLLVPLIRSRMQNNELESFQVEVILALSENHFSWIGEQESRLPAVDLLISQLIWSVYLPNDYNYNYFASSLEKEEIIRGLNLWSGAKREYDDQARRQTLPEMPAESEMLSMDEMKKAYKGKELKSRFRNIPMAEEQIASQMEAEIGFGDRMEGLSRQDQPQAAVGGGQTSTGILPIMIQIPTGGQIYRFAKTIIKPEDPLTFSVIYSQLWIISSLKWFVFIAVMIFLFLFRKKLQGPWKWLRMKTEQAVKYYQAHENKIKQFSQSRMTPFILFGLILLFWSISGFVTLILLFLFWISVVYQVLNFRRRKKVQVVQAPLTIDPQTGKENKHENSGEEQ